jgi:sugar phosphate isomerase/epimerase
MRRAAGNLRREIRILRRSWRYTIPGHGEVEWSKVAVRLDRIGYEGAVCIELEDRRYWGSPEREREGIAKALAHLSLYFR